jgi:NADP-dependent 3-hydroxy acid dehydrogenase YdfG
VGNRGDDGHIDIIVNPGAALLGPTDAVSEERFEETFGLKVKVSFFLVAMLAPTMAERG